MPFELFTDEECKAFECEELRAVLHAYHVTECDVTARHLIFYKPDGSAVESLLQHGAVSLYCEAC